MEPNDEIILILTNKRYQLLNTLEENLNFLTLRQHKQSKQSRELYKSIRTPTVGDLKAVISMNIIKNNLARTDDMNLAKINYGPGVGGITGKTTRIRQMIAVRNIVEIPNELLEVQKALIVSMDGLTVNSLKFLSMISH